jgi:hypothetical protein
VGGRERDPGQPYRPSKQIMRTLIERGPTNAGSAMRLNSLRRRYPEAYYRITLEKMGQARLIDG